MIRVDWFLGGCGFLVASCGCAYFGGPAWPEARALSAGRLLAAGLEPDIDEVDTSAPQEEKTGVRVGIGVCLVHAGPDDSQDNTLVGLRDRWPRMSAEIGKGKHSLLASYGGLDAKQSKIYPGSEWAEVTWSNVCVYYRYYARTTGKLDWFLETGAQVIEVEIETQTWVEGCQPQGYFVLGGGVRWSFGGGQSVAFLVVSVNLLLGRGASVSEVHPTWSAERDLKKSYADLLVALGITL